jgi:hypothetical protein
LLFIPAKFSWAVKNGGGIFVLIVAGEPLKNHLARRWRR